LAKNFDRIPYSSGESWYDFIEFFCFLDEMKQRPLNNPPGSHVQTPQFFSAQVKPTRAHYGSGLGNDGMTGKRSLYSEYVSILENKTLSSDVKIRKDRQRVFRGKKYG
jgi:hypothetical protein